MALSEFSLIQQYFSSLGKAPGIALGVGDDGALLEVPEGEQLIAAVDTLVAGIHFPQDASPGDIAQRSLRVNLSDIAAMGGTPRWFTLALTLPEAQEAWLDEFAQALSVDAERFKCALVGGDTTSGPLSITIQILGTVPQGKALTRHGARAGDKVYVTGSLGEGAAALLLFGSDCPGVADNGYIREALLRRFYQPEPRLTEGVQLRGLASAALDVSDGLLADLGHIAEASHLGSNLQFEQLPVAAWLNTLAEPTRVANWVLSGGDDYELCFTVPEQHCARVDALIEQGEFSACCIGQMTTEPGIRCFDAQGVLMDIEQPGYQHF